jgi:hypothetical protein
LTLICNFHLDNFSPKLVDALDGDDAILPADFSSLRSLLTQLQREPQARAYGPENQLHDILLDSDTIEHYESTVRHYSPLLPPSETYPCSAYFGGNLRSGVPLNNIRYRVGEEGDSVLNVIMPRMSSRKNGAVMQKFMHDYPMQHQCLRASVRLKAPPRPSEPQAFYNRTKR